MISASYVGALSRTLEISLAEWEISSGTQMKNRACVRCMAEQTGVHGVIFHANAATCMPGHALELFVPALMLLRACAVHARHAHVRREHKMGDKCIPAAPNQLLTAFWLRSCSHHVCSDKIPRIMRHARPATRLHSLAARLRACLLTAKIWHNLGFFLSPKQGVRERPGVP